MGQGLTDEWRAEYPEDHQNCWKSGCHGDKPYEDGFTLPDTVPAIIGDGTLHRFQTLGDLYEYTRVRMPFEYPGVLSNEEYLAVTAFMAQENDLWDGVPLTEANVVQVLGFTGHVNVSIGVASRSEKIPDPATLLRAADHALKAAKKAGRNRVCVAEGSRAVRR